MLDDNLEDITLIKQLVKELCKKHKIENCDFIPEDENQYWEINQHLETYFKATDDDTTISEEYIDNIIKNSKTILIDYDFSSSTFNGLKLYDIFLKKTTRILAFLSGDTKKNSKNKMREAVNNAQIDGETLHVFYKPFRKDEEGCKKVNTSHSDYNSLKRFLEEIISKPQGPNTSLITE